jgi:GxxExxY protein
VPLRELCLLSENSIATQIVDAAYQIHVALGPGLLESVYQHILAAELADRGLQVELQRPIPILYRGLELEIGFRADIVVENLVIAEIKSVEAVHPVYRKQLLTYLRLADKRLGLMINFNVELIKDGISRVVNGLTEDKYTSRQGAKTQRRKAPSQADSRASQPGLKTDS